MAARFAAANNTLAARLRRILSPVEPWYDWGKITVERLEEITLDGDGRIEAGGEGEVRFCQLQWLGIHFGLQIGRAPKAVR